MIKKKLEEIGESLEVVLLGVVLVIIPAIPGVVLWFFLQPATFWQKLAWFVVSLILYIVVLGLEAKILEES